MADILELEMRVSALEREVAGLKKKPPADTASSNWVDQLSGSMRDYPEFDEVAALGKAAREADLSPDVDNDAT